MKAIACVVKLCYHYRAGKAVVKLFSTTANITEKVTVACASFYCCVSRSTTPKGRKGVSEQVVAAEAFLYRGGWGVGTHCGRKSGRG